MPAEVLTADEDDDEGELEIDDPDLCEWCQVNNARWSNKDGVGWCGECDKSGPARLKPSEN